MIDKILMIILLTLMPVLEARASIPYGIFVGVPWWIVILVASITNIILAALCYALWGKIINWFRWIKIVDKIYVKVIKRSQKKAQPLVDKYGVLGLAIFIGIPLPGSGVYTGSLISELFGMSFKRFMISAVIGVFIASTIVAIISLSGVEFLSFLIKAPL